MKIAMVVNSDPASDGRVRREAQALAAAGHDVTVFGASWKGSVGRQDRLGFAIVRPILPPWAAGEGAWNLLRKAVCWYGRLRPLVDAAMASRPDALHAHDLDTIGPASEAALARGIPCIYDDHEASYVDKLPNYVPTDISGPKHAALEGLRRWLQRRGETLERRVRTRNLAALVTVADFLADRLVERFGGPRPVVVRNLPAWRVVPRTDALRERLGAPRDAKLLLYHGTVTEGRGVDAVIRAMRGLPSDYRFVVVGRVLRKERYETLARESGVADRVLFVPFVDEDEMFRLVASADVSIVPTEPISVSFTLSLPNKLFELMMVGTPVVATDLPEVASILRRTGAGLVYPPTGPEAPAALASRVRELCEDRARWQACSEAGRRAVHDELNWERESRKLVAIYERMA